MKKIKSRIKQFFAAVVAFVLFPAASITSFFGLLVLIEIFFQHFIY